jgi:transglutaminase-like putative cysteine protease
VSAPVPTLDLPTAAPNPPGEGHPRGALVDAAFAFGLTTLAVGSLHLAFGGWAYLAIGATGAALAAAVVLATERLRVDLLVTVVLLLVAAALGSGVAVPESAAGLAPTPATVGGLIDGLVSGWKGVITLAPPVGVTGGLGAVPYALGFAGSAVALLLARRTASSLAPAVPVVAVLVAGFLLGTDEPVSVVVHGGVTVGAALAWGSIRSHRTRHTSRPDAVPVSRIGAAAAMVIAVTVLGLLIGPRLPFVPAERFDLRQQIVPPFDPRNEPSPLAAYRNYLKVGSRDEVLFTVSGLPAGARLRLAAMDTYDGVVWALGGPRGPATGRFDRLGGATTEPGTPAEVTVRVARDRADVWTPTVEATEAVRFEGDRAAALRAAFRYSRTNRTGAVPPRLAAGDSYTLDARLLPPADPAALRTAAPVGAATMPGLPPLTESLTKRAAALTASAASPYDKAAALARALHDGTPELPTYYSDGGAGTERSAAAASAGHSVGRLTRFLDADGGLVGNGEQYAAAMAVMARAVGLPAQVVVGFRPGSDPATGPAPAAGPAPAPAAPGGPVEVRGRDVDAWVEIAFAGAGWVPFDPTPPRDRQPDDSPKPQPKELELTQQPPPPPTRLRIPEDNPDLVARPPEPVPPEEGPLEAAAGILATVAVAGSPVLLALAAAGLILAAKAVRARRRRRRGPPARRLAGAWWETCDRARDLGATVPVGATRREVAEAVAPEWPAVGRLAVAVDASMFADEPPSTETVAELWGALDGEHRAVVGGLPLRRRWRARLSLASLRPGRWRRTTGHRGDDPQAPPDEFRSTTDRLRWDAPSISTSPLSPSSPFPPSSPDAGPPSVPGPPGRSTPDRPEPPSPSVPSGAGARSGG